MASDGTNISSTTLGQNTPSAGSLRLFGTDPTTRKSVAHEVDENINPFLRSPTPRVLTNATDIENMGPPMIGCQRASKTSKHSVIVKALKILQAASVTPTEFLTQIAIGNHPDLYSYHQKLFSNQNKPTLQALLNAILNDEKGAVTMEDWMAPHALDLVCKNIHREMDAAKPLLKMSVGEITPEFLSKWDVNTVMRPAELATPTLTRCIEAATESRKSQDSTKGSKSRNRETVRNFETYHFYLSLVYLKGRHLLHAQLHYYRSFHSCKCQIALGLFFWSCGVRHKLCLE